MDAEKLLSLMKEIRDSYVGDEVTILRAVDLPREMSISFALFIGDKVHRCWAIKMRDISSLPEKERFILTSVHGRDFVVKYICNFKLELSSIFEYIYPLCLDEEWVEILRQIEQKEATEVSRKLLLRCLYGTQLKDFQNMEAFFVHSENEKFLLTRNTILSLDEEDKPVNGFCIHPKDWIPVYDKMLSIKLLLECNLPLFYATANKNELSFSNKITATIVIGQLKLKENGTSL